MSYDISYKGLPRKEADEKAIKDIKEYVSDKAWDMFQQQVGAINAGIGAVGHLDHLMGFCGIRGYPFHAFCRAYCLKAYRAWMASGNEPIQTDEEGFRIDG